MKFKNWLRPAIILVIGWSTAHAQQLYFNGNMNAGINPMYGAGLWGGQQSCGYKVQIPEAVNGIDAEIESMNSMLRTDESDLRKLKDDKAKIMRELYSPKEGKTSSMGSCKWYGRAPEKIKQLADFQKLSPNVQNLFMEHIATGANCSEYYYKEPETKAADEKPEVKSEANELAVLSARSSGAGDSSFPRTDASRNLYGRVNKATADAWIKQYCGNDGQFNCDIQPLGNKYGRELGLNEWSKKYRDCSGLEVAIEKLESDIKGARERISELRGERTREMNRSITEAQACPTGECYKSRSSMRNDRDWTSIWTNAGLGIGLTMIGRGIDRDYMRQNADQGISSSPSANWTIGYPFIANAIYGALGGNTGAGGFGCAGGANGAGNVFGNMGMQGPLGNGSIYQNAGNCIQASGCPFNNPFALPLSLYGNTLGGGMYNQGLNPWGLNGPGAMMNGQFNLGMNNNSMFGNPNMIGGGYPIAGVSGGYNIDPLTGQMIMNGGGNSLWNNPNMTNQYLYNLEMQKRMISAQIEQQRASAGIYMQIQSLYGRLGAIQNGSGVNFGMNNGSLINGSFNLNAGINSNFGAGYNLGAGYSPYGSSYNYGNSYSPYGNTYNPYGNSYLNNGYNNQGLGPGGAPPLR